MSRTAIFVAPDALLHVFLSEVISILKISIRRRTIHLLESYPRYVGHYEMP